MTHFFKSAFKYCSLLNMRPVSRCIVVQKQWYMDQLSSTLILNGDAQFQLVDEPTRGRNVLDKFFVNRDDLYTVSVVKICVKTNHLAVVACAAVETHTGRGKQSKLPQPTLYDIREQHLVKLREALERYNWTNVYIDPDINSAYSALLEVLKWHINEYIPTKRVSLGSRPPSYVTPLVKVLLRRRNKLRRRGRSTEADVLSTKIGKLKARLHCQLIACNRLNSTD